MRQEIKFTEEVCERARHVTNFWMLALGEFFDRISGRRGRYGAPVKRDPGDMVDAATESSCWWLRIRDVRRADSWLLNRMWLMGTEDARSRVALGSVKSLYPVSCLP